MQTELNAEAFARTPYFRLWCLKHIQHLIVKRHLARVEQYLPTYWSTLSKIINCWRSSRKPCRIKTELKLRHGEGAAKKVNRLPPRNLRGRWGSQHGAETYLIRAGRTQTTDMFQCVFSASSSTVDAGRAAAGEVVFWDEGQTEYKQRMGKWVADSIAALLDVD